MKTRHIVPVLVLLGVVGCGGNDLGNPADEHGVQVTIDPTTASVARSGQRAFAAAVTGSSTRTVTWTIQEGSSGGSVSGAGLYTAPGSAGTYHVVASSVADPTKTATATVTVVASGVAVTVSPKAVSLATGTTQAFTATVTGASNTTVTWSVQEASGCGTITPGGNYSAPATAATCHVVATSAADATKSDVAVVTVTAATPVVATKRWVTGYYAAYYGDTYYPHTMVDMTKMTHFMFARAQPNADGTITLAAGVYGNTMAAPLVARAHAAGTKALLMAGGVGDYQYWYPAASDATRARFVTNILALLDSYGFDGIDIDWEEYLDNSGSYPDTQRRLLALLQDLRAARPSLIITFPAPWVNKNIGLPFPASWALQVANVVDQFNVMSYDMTANWGWNTWFFSALDGAGALTPTSIVATVAAYRAAGIPASKIGIGIGFYGHATEAPNTGPNQAYSGADHGGQDFLLRSSNIIQHYLAEYPGHATKVWNPSAKMYALSSATNWAPSGTNDWSQAWFPVGFLTWEDEASIEAKARYVRDNGLGGTIIWTIDNGCTNTSTGANPYLDAVGNAFLGKTPPNPIISRGVPAHASSGTAANANTATGSPARYYASPWTAASTPAWLAYDISGVPPHQRGAAVAYVHNDVGLTDFTQATIPASYVIQGHAGAGGGAPPADADAGWVTIGTVTGNTWNGRQTSINLTSGTTIFNWVRIRIASGSASLFFDVHDASQGANDDVVVFGDSITVGWANHNPYSAADATAAGAQSQSLSDMVLASRSGRMPVFQPAGVVGQYSSGAQASFTSQLATAQGRYVAIAFGTNEALNSWSDAAHHTLFITAMQSMINSAKAAGKTVIIPRTIPYSTNAAVVATAPTIHSWIAEILASNPDVVPGPDQWAWGQAHPQFLSDGIHYGATGGYLALRAFWAQWLLANLY